MFTNWLAEQLNLNVIAQAIYQNKVLSWNNIPCEKILVTSDIVITYYEK
jgi:hypothetical protein